MLGGLEWLLLQQVAESLHDSDGLGLLRLILVKVVASLLTVAVQVELVAGAEGGFHNHEAHLLLVFVCTARLV